MDDDSYTAAGTKKKIIGNYFNNICGVLGAALYNDEVFKDSVASQVSLSTSAVFDCIEIDTDKVLYVYVDTTASSNLKGRIATLSANGTLTFGTEFVIDATGATAQPHVAKVEGTAGKFAVTWVATNTVKVVCGTTSGTTATLGTVVNLSTNSNKMTGIASINTDKIAVVYTDNTDFDLYTKVSTISGTTISAGTQTSLWVGTSAAFDSSRQNLVVKLNTDKFAAIVYDSSSHWVLAATVSGTTPTAGTAVTLSNTYASTHGMAISQLTTDKIIVAGVNIKAQVVTFSGTVPTPQTIKTVASTSGSANTINFVKISATKGMLIKYITNGMALFPIDISSSNQVFAGDEIDVSIVAGISSWNADMIRIIPTTNYTAIFGVPNATALYAAAIRDMNVDIEVNGTLVVNDRAVKMYENIPALQSATFGRKQYIKITNNTANTQKISIQNIIANVE
jgi:hypothetical protein